MHEILFRAIDLFDFSENGKFREIDSFHFTSFLACTFLNFLAHCTVYNTYPLIIFFFLFLYKVSGRDTVIQLLEQVEKFQTAAKKLLSQKTDDVEELNKVIETGSGLDVDLPELEELKQKSKQVKIS